MPAKPSGDQNQLWELSLNYISLRIKGHSFNTWFKHTRAEEDNGHLKIIVPNNFVADWLHNHYAQLINEALQEVGGREIPYIFETDGNGREQTEIEFYPVTHPVPAIPGGHGNSNGNGGGTLNDQYRFENLVVGDFNQFAHAVAVAVAEAPGATKYNPLTIYGGTGLGKTHLAQAIGLYVLSNHKSKKVMYASSEKFTSDFINSLSNGTVASFTSKYRSVDVLLIDDIQFFSGKESTQEQFFHTFNDLFHSGKQIVLTSDRHPRDTKGLEERLLSRFSSGLVADLQPPDLETRVAILRHKTAREEVPLAEDVLYFVADHVTSNIRELEGCLTRLLAFASLEKKPVDLEFAQRVLGKEFLCRKKEVTIPGIIKETCQVFRVDPNLMISRRKTSEIALARQVAMYLSRKFTPSSLKTIGDSFGGRDHSTVIHACDLVANRIGEDFGFKDKVDTIAAKIQG